MSRGPGGSAGLFRAAEAAQEEHGIVMAQAVALGAVVRDEADHVEAKSKAPGLRARVRVLVP